MNNFLKNKKIYNAVNPEISYDHWVIIIKHMWKHAYEMHKPVPGVSKKLEIIPVQIFKPINKIALVMWSNREPNNIHWLRNKIYCSMHNYT